MAGLARRLGAVIALAGLWMAMPAFALTDAQLREKLPDEVPDDAIVKAWAGVPDRTLVAWIDYRSVAGAASPKGQDAPDAVDLTVLVVQTSSGRVAQRYREDDAWTTATAEFDHVDLDTADYALAPDRPAFGVRLSGMHRGYVAEEDAFLHLLEPDGAALRPVLALQTHDYIATRDCGPGHDITRTVAIGRTATQGHADLVVHEKRAVTPDGSAHPDNCNQKTRHDERTVTLRFDGRRYPALPR